MKQITENQAKIQRVLIGLGIESSLQVVDEWRVVLWERGQCTSIEGAIKLLRECVRRADHENQPIQRPSESGKWIGLIIREREELEEKSKPQPTVSKNLSQIANEAQERESRDKDRVNRFRVLFGELLELESENGSLDDLHHARSRAFSEHDLKIGRVRDNSERYVSNRIRTLRMFLGQRDRSSCMPNAQMNGPKAPFH